jgi:hypothetical protein
MKTEKSASVETWLEQIRSGNIEHNTAKVLNYISERSKYEKVTIDNLKKDLKMLHPTATSCITALLDNGLIQETGKIKKAFITESRSRVITYTTFTSVESVEIRNILIKCRRLQKFNDWIKRGINDFSDFIPDEDKKALLNCLIEPFNEQKEK